MKTLGAIYPMPKQYGVSIRLNRLLSRLKKVKVQELVISPWYENRILKLYYIKKQLLSILFSSKPDAIFTAAPLISGSLSGLFAKRIKKKPLILDWDDSFYNFKEFKPEPWKFAYWEYQAVKKADAVIVVSKNLADTASYLRGSRKNIYYIPNGADVSVFNPAKYNSSALRREFGYSDDDIIVLFVAHIGFVGGKFVGKELADAAKECSEIKNLKFLVVGYGKGLPQLQEYVKQNGLDNFKFAGFVDNSDMPRHIAVSDICIDVIWDPEKNNMQNRSSMKLKEYMSMAKAAIALNVGENITDLDKGKCGLLIEYKHESIVGAIRKLALDPNLRRKMGKAARKRIIQKYNLAKQAQIFEKIIHHNL